MKIHLEIIKIILQNIPYKNKSLLLELIKAELMTSSGYLTELAMMINPKKYHTIHKIFNRVKFDYVAIQIKIIVMILSLFKILKVSISIDDSIVYRSRKKKVPYGHKQYDHANKANRSTYVFGQKWLTFGLIITIKGMTITLPLFIYLVKPKKNLISRTIVILKKIKKVIDEKNLNIEVEILTDSWFARKRLVLWTKKQSKFSVITMARRDLAVYKLAPARRKNTKGRPKKKGKRIQPELKDLKKTRTLFIYGKEVQVRYKEVIAKAKFLEYETVRAVWVAFDTSQSIRLLIATDTTLSGEEVIRRYAKRWDIESMFNELKNRFRFKDIMMHTSQTYYQFLYFKIWSFMIIKLSYIHYKERITDYVRESLPWRVLANKKVKITPGVTKLALRRVFSTLHIDLFFPKLHKKIERKCINTNFIGISLNEEYEMGGNLKNTKQ